jgi:hypothetical protein
VALLGWSATSRDPHGAYADIESAENVTFPPVTDHDGLLRSALIMSRVIVNIGGSGCPTPTLGAPSSLPVGNDRRGRSHE